MQLRTQTHFRQGWNTDLIEDVESLGIDAIRDSVAWHQVETKAGKYDFSHRSADWVNEALDAGLDVLLVFDPHNGLYDKGQTIFSKKALAAFADFVVATLKEFPGVSAIEIGNEYNGNDFVKGKIANATKAERENYYKAMVVAIDSALDKAGIDVTVIGGSTHSIPIDYIDELNKNGTLDLVDGVSIHPYTTDPEQFADQLMLLRERIGDDIEIHVTEFGSNFDHAEEAPAYLAKMVSVMAAADVDTANWYAFATQSAYPFMELWDQKLNQPTLAGVTFSIFEDLLEEMEDDGGEVDQIALDDYTYFYSFGDNAAVIWGEPRSVELGEGVTAYDLAGKEISDFAWLSPDMPVFLRSDTTITVDSVSFGDNYLLADSFHDFDVVNATGTLAGFEGPWSYFAMNGNGKEYLAESFGGDIGGGQPWTPYLGLDWLKPFQIGAEIITPVDFSKNDNPSSEYAVVERYTAASDGDVTIHGHWDVANNSTDGVKLTVSVNGKTIFEKHISDASNGYVFDLDLSGISLKQGDELDFIISSRGEAKGDVTTRRIQIYSDDVPFSADDQPVSYIPVLPDFAPQPEVNPFDRSDADTRVTLKGSDADDAIFGGSGNDQLSGGGGSDAFYGGAGNDKIYATAADYHIDGGAGRDLLYLSGNQGVDLDVTAANVEWVSGTKTHDNLDGSAATADLYLKGNNGADTLRGGSGDDDLIGGNGYDELFGGAGRDFLNGGNGNDRLDGGAGNDKLIGGKGADVFVFNDGFGDDVITDFGKGDVIDLSGITGIDGFDDLNIRFFKKAAVVTIGDDEIRIEDVTQKTLTEADFLF